MDGEVVREYSAIRKEVFGGDNIGVSREVLGRIIVTEKSLSETVLAEMFWG